MDPLVLTVDVAGLPQAWVELEEAITYHAKQMVAWSVGREVREFRGGWQKNGVRSRIATRSILAIKGSGAGAHRHAPGLTNQMLFVRDRQVCAYCGGRFMVRDLSRDHVVPVSRGGKDAWTNAVTACRSCNTRKGGRSPEQAGMPLLYVPYRAEPATSNFTCANAGSSRPDANTCSAGVPKTSRLHAREGRALTQAE
jgi:5-methylcytosine-specific restriction endonuclease McrA